MSVMVDPLIPALEAFQRGEYPPDPLIDRLKILAAKIERTRRYRELRAQHRGEHWWTAKMCWDEAGRVYEWDWEEITEPTRSFGYEVNLEVDGLDVNVRMIADDEPFPRGSFENGCNLPEAPLFLIQRCPPQRCPPDERNDRHSDYFIPESGCTLEDVRSHRLGRHESWVQARRTLMEDVKRGANLDNEFTQWGCVVTVTKRGVELAETACWGIEFSSEDPWSDAWQHEAETHAKGDFVPEALAEAHDKLKELTA